MRYYIHPDKTGTRLAKGVEARLAYARKMIIIIIIIIISAWHIPDARSQPSRGRMSYTGLTMHRVERHGFESYL